MNPDDLKPAPPPLRLVQQFLNTRSLMRNFDLLDTQGNFCRWYEGVTGSLPSWAPDQESLEHLISLREALRAGLLIRSSASLQEASSVGEQITQLVAPDALKISFSASAEPRLAPRWEGARGFEGMLLQAAVDAHYRGTWHRLKVCASEGCRWAFYDASKNRSAAWCDMAICGARAKMRTYRKRRHATVDE
ncbi:CGNR zinc finger domain-containing protein [Nesterenkonia natronophila]|uniref:Zf-CGNR multi-domain protein n=1 Tax=Nesterenkonia natronophila TaxID=2174932 RepID=A0A3A4F3S1_9MICC|nr:CGNR zinc finger domain-containing protein [Nesterenkonia natronophila]RJN32508.1 zf-CGNR multi-domain protein [Nesterenkonia natronophila]